MDALEINDDENEKRHNQKRRDKRKSVGVGFLTTEHRRSGAHLSGSAAGTTTSRTLTSSELESLFQNCIKLSSENKINVKNTWNLNLIDYIGEVLETTLTGGSFQAASCTLDAGVKIYSTRVDSVHTEAYKVLTSFARADPQKGSSSENNEEEDGANKDGDEKSKKKRVRHGVNTLETNINNITVKKLELSYVIEPLYHTSLGSSNNFDVGSANSLLLNNLGLGYGCEVIIDSKNWDYAYMKSTSENNRPNQTKQTAATTEQQRQGATSVHEEEERIHPIALDKSAMGRLLTTSFVDEKMLEEMEERAKLTQQQQQSAQQQENDGMPLQLQPFSTEENQSQPTVLTSDANGFASDQPPSLTDNFTFDVGGGFGGGIDDFGPPDTATTENGIIPQTYGMPLDTTTQIPHKLSIGGDAANALITAVTEVGGLAPDHFANAHHDDDDDDDDGLGIFDTDFANSEPQDVVPQEIGDDDTVIIEQQNKLQANEPSQPTSITEMIQKNPETITVDNDYEYFDATKIKHWAGIEHWKPSAKSKTQGTNAKKSKKRTQKSKPHVFDFLNDPSSIDYSVQFKYSKKPEDNQIKNLPTKLTLLPTDVHYDLSMLLRPFNLPAAFTDKHLQAVVEQGARSKTSSSSSANSNTEPPKTTAPERLTQDGMFITTSSKLYDDSDEDEEMGLNAPHGFGEMDIGGFDNFDTGFGTNNTTTEAAQPSADATAMTTMTDIENNQTNITMATSSIEPPSSFEHQQDTVNTILNDSNNSMTMEDIQLKPQELNNPNEVTMVAGAKLIEAPKLVQKLNITYATRAKQVDVRALKDHLWTEIETTSRTDLNFSDVVSSLNTSKPKANEKKPDFSEVSVPFCFICMLHLCNEQNLELEGTPDFSDFKVVKPASAQRRRSLEEEMVDDQ
ncbi:hypothetical protein C9374_002976 [Naegleria lovaniensis]|uniref:Condensin complex subunit 2 n=1 Tax=Naegleria lovaniensis TaxID=51637 RepID=A0AA88KPX2_NAELO|nr:uncharacterized protein C9374_002976 [Naegleria lovaniensis]KAG2385827.1 hypothetical protein C9374_002976 [Naegleria lovaniensis]